jgi:lipopolysaccharide/colanic/teichoic acid biosynthesis glycosyltransferase
MNNEMMTEQEAEQVSRRAAAGAVRAPAPAKQAVHRRLDAAESAAPGLGPTPRGAYVRFVKPAIDAFVATLLVAVFLPLMLMIALTLRATLGSPVLFRQPRVGRGGRTFTVLKFRTMAPDRRTGDSGMRYVGVDRRVTHKSRHDPRLHPFGRFLRKWSLDELPQLLNVMRGDMSLVGPRPELVDIVARYHPWQHRRHEVKPGMTGLWQVSARGDGMMHEHVDIDLEYVDAVSLRTDTSILLRTIPAALGRAPGY